MLESYASVAARACVEHVVRRSRFIANVFPVQGDADTLKSLQRVRDAHPGATHVCFAYRHGLDTEVVRFSDAGEPSGTAGRPILEVIEREGLQNTLVTVTRYFGGILLGAAGLVRAYSGAAALGIAAAGRATYVLQREYCMALQYPEWGRVEHLLGELGATVLKTAYGAEVSIRVRVPVTRIEALLGYLRDATGGRLEAHSSGEGYYPLT